MGLLSYGVMARLGTMETSRTQKKRKIDLFTDSHRGAWGPLSRESDTWVDSRVSGRLKLVMSAMLLRNNPG